MDHPEFSLYDFLGIPPGSPPNLIYVAMRKLQKTDWSQYPNKADERRFMAMLEEQLWLVKTKLLLTEQRQSYEKQWEAYYLPGKGDPQALQKYWLRAKNSDFFRTGLKIKSAPFTVQPQTLPQPFTYQRDFLHFMMYDLLETRKVIFLDYLNPTPLGTGTKQVIFQEPDFCLDNKAGEPVTINNDAIGTVLTLDGLNIVLPLHTGDRIEFENGSRFILREVYAPSASVSEQESPFYLKFRRENVAIKLSPAKIYIVGRNTSDIIRLQLPEERFCFINIARRDRSISRQNFQLFFHQSQWYIQDLGSRYGTTLDFVNHCKFETLSGGAIMALEPGKIRLGYDKSYAIEVTSEPPLLHKDILVLQKADELSSVYDFAMLC